MCCLVPKSQKLELSMFGKSLPPQRQPFKLKIEEITEDIESISLNNEQRNKLYLCLENQPPKNEQFGKVEDFLKGTDDLEVVKRKLDNLINEVDNLVLLIHKKIGEIHQNISNA